MILFIKHKGANSVAKSLGMKMLKHYSVKSTGSGAQLPEFQPQLSWLLIVQAQASFLASLGLSFPIWNMGPLELLPHRVISTSGPTTYQITKISNLWTILGQPPASHPTSSQSPKLPAVFTNYFPNPTLLLISCLNHCSNFHTGLTSPSSLFSQTGSFLNTQLIFIIHRFRIVLSLAHHNLFLIQNLHLRHFRGHL